MVEMGTYLYFLLWIALSSKHVVLAGKEADKGACYFDSNVKKGLSCESSITKVDQDVFFVPEQTSCFDESKDKKECLTCIEGILLEMDCSEAPKRREKRWFWRRRRRSPPPPPPNNPPKITCPSIANTVYAPSGSNTAVVTWSNAVATDQEGTVTPRLTSGKGSGTRFSEGTHTVSYSVIDNGGLTAVCSVSFRVSVRKCPVPNSPSNGRVQCPSTYAGSNVVYGNKCTYICNSGYQLSGAASVTCNSNGRFSSSSTCSRISCGTPPVPRNANSVSCNQGHLYKSVCSPRCATGYQPGKSARLVCQASKKWTPTSWVCEDNAAPVFTSCPKKKILTIDRRFKWTVTAKDNSGKVTLKQVQGHAPGSRMDYGVHFIKYVATDASGHSATCAFAVELQATDCPKPSSNDTDINFLCNGMKAKSVCQLSCKSGARVKGSHYISCVQDKSDNNTSVWKPIEGEMAFCNKRTCPPLNTPKNGALICDKKLGGSFCQIQCNEDFDVPYSDMRFHTFACDNGADTWLPSNTAPDCLELSFPDEYSLPTEFFYYIGDCSNPAALNAIKQQFIDNLNSIGLSPCMKDVCSVDDVDVSCGDAEDPDFDFRRKRTSSAKPVLRVHLRFHVKNSNRTLTPDKAAALLKSLADKSKDLMSTNMAIRTMNSKPSTPQKGTTVKKPSGWSVASTRRTAYMKPMMMQSLSLSSARLPSEPAVPASVKSESVTGKLEVRCETGHEALESGTCVPCSVGSYSDVKTDTCNPCPLNTYQDKAARTSCLACPAHHVTSSTGAAARDQCKEQCGVDTFSPTGLLPCFPCPEGKYQPKYGAKTCLPCPKSGTIPRKCLQDTSKSANSTDLQISNFLLTCDSETCLSF